MSPSFAGVFRPIPGLLREAIPPELGTFEWSASSSMAKAWFGNRSLHYEIWVRHGLKVVELGLHFESDALTNARLLGAFRSRAREVKSGLGKEARIEEWDRGWSRVWEPFALQDMDRAYAERIRGRFIDYVRVLEPILRDELPSDVEWNLAAQKRRTAPTRVTVPTRAATGSARRGSRSAR